MSTAALIFANNKEEFVDQVLRTTPPSRQLDGSATWPAVWVHKKHTRRRKEDGSMYEHRQEHTELHKE